MKLPVIKGVIKRRILINYQIDPEVIVKYLPPIFKPKVIQGKSIIGVCLIRLEQIRPKSIRTSLGISSENAAHRIAVQWNDETGKLCDGVYIFRRDSNSRLNYLLGGRLFPGEHNRAKFIVNDSDEKINYQLISSDHKVNIRFQTRFSDSLPQSSIFKSINEISSFFKSGSEGYSPVKGKECYQGMCLIPLITIGSPKDSLPVNFDVYLLDAKINNTIDKDIKALYRRRNLSKLGLYVMVTGFAIQVIASIFKFRTL